MIIRLNNSRSRDKWDMSIGLASLCDRLNQNPILNLKCSLQFNSLNAIGIPLKDRFTFKIPVCRYHELALGLRSYIRMPSPRKIFTNCRITRIVLVAATDKNQQREQYKCEPYIHSVW